MEVHNTENVDEIVFSLNKMFYMASFSQMTFYGIYEIKLLLDHDHVKAHRYSMPSEWDLYIRAGIEINGFNKWHEKSTSVLQLIKNDIYLEPFGDNSDPLKCYVMAHLLGSRIKHIAIDKNISDLIIAFEGGNTLRVLGREDIFDESWIIRSGEFRIQCENYGYVWADLPALDM